MALRGALTHWKTRRLALRLGIEPWAALGILEALWHCTAEDAPGGNIGRLPDDAIAAQMFYAGNPSELMAALVDSRHLEPHFFHRYIIHDWHIHADYNTKRKLIRRKENILDNSGAELHPMTRHDASETGHDDSETRHNPFPTRHNPTPVPAPASGPEPEPAPEPEPVTPSLRSGEKASLPPKQVKSGSAKNDAGATRRGGDASLAAARARNTLALGAKPPKVISDSEARRQKWAREEVELFWAGVNGVDKANIPWSERDAAALTATLDAWMNSKRDDWQLCLANRAKAIHAGWLSPSLQPSKWLRDLPSFMAGPLDHDLKPIPMVRGRLKQKGDAR